MHTYIYTFWTQLAPRDDFGAGGTQAEWLSHHALIWFHRAKTMYRERKRAAERKMRDWEERGEEKKDYLQKSKGGLNFSANENDRRPHHHHSKRSERHECKEHADRIAVSVDHKCEVERLIAWRNVVGVLSFRIGAVSLRQHQHGAHEEYRCQGPKVVHTSVLVSVLGRSEHVLRKRLARAVAVLCPLTVSAVQRIGVPPQLLSDSATASRIKFNQLNFDLYIFVHKFRSCNKLVLTTTTRTSSQICDFSACIIW